MELAELKKMYDFSGQTFVVTGGTGVLGSQMTLALLACGANVALLVRDEVKAVRVLQAAESAKRAFIVKGDVLVREELQAAAEKILAHFGRIDGLINGAGGNTPQATTSADLSFFELVTGRTQLRADLQSLANLEAYLDGISVKKGDGPLAVDLYMDKGFLGPKSRLDYQTAALEVAGRGFGVRSDLRLDLDAAGEKSKDVGTPLLPRCVHGRAQCHGGQDRSAGPRPR